MTMRTRIPSPTEAASHQAAQPAVSAGDIVIGAAMPPTKPQVIEVPRPEVKLYPPKIAKAILAITRKIDPVAKAGKNTFHKYTYAKWEDILDVLSPLIAENGLIIQQSEVSHGGFSGDLIEITYEFTIINEDGDVWPDRPSITSICKIRDQKGVLDDKASSKCFTQAQKYMMVGLFKIRTADISEADHDADRPRSRPVPSPSGWIEPHTVQATDNDTAQTWTERLIGFLAKAKSHEELMKWDELNGGFIDRVQQRDVSLYNRIVDALNRLNKPAEGGAGFAAKEDNTPPSPPASQKPAVPGPNDDGLDIPPALRRAPPLTDDERDWLAGLAGGFSGCEDMTSLAEEQERLMKPVIEKVSKAARDRAESILAENIERINAYDEDVK